MNCSHNPFATAVQRDYENVHFNPEILNTVYDLDLKGHYIRLHSTWRKTKHFRRFLIYAIRHEAIVVFGKPSDTR